MNLNDPVPAGEFTALYGDDVMSHLRRFLCPQCGARLEATHYGYRCSEISHGPHWHMSILAEAMGLSITSKMRGSAVKRAIRNFLADAQA